MIRHKIKIERSIWGAERPRSLSKKDRVCQKIIDYGILGLLIFCPLPAGSVNEWSILVIQLTVLLMLGAYYLMKAKPRGNNRVEPSMRWSKYLFFAFFLFLLLQLLPMPKILISVLSSNTISFQNAYSYDFQSMKFLSLSIIPFHSLRQGLELLSYFLLGFLIVKTVTKRDQIKRIITVLVAMGVFQALYGLFELYNKNPRILFYQKIHGLDSATGTFVNRNHFSGYLEMIIPLAIGLVIARIDLFSMVGLSWRLKLVKLSDKKISSHLILSVGIILMSIGVIFSKSRSGIFVLVFSFILIFGLSVLYFETTKRQAIWTRRFLVALFLVIVFISLQVGINAALERFAMDKPLSEGRPTYWANTLKIFSQYPIFGTGLGTFTSLYPDSGIDGNSYRLYHAHNDYLEYLTELGVIGMTLLLGGICYVLVNSFLTWRVRRHPEVKGIALGGIVSVVCMLVHSLTDFNLHIPANMLLFSVILSLTVVTAHYKRGKGNKNPKM